jgi:hypothetical protein
MPPDTSSNPLPEQDQQDIWNELEAEDNPELGAVKASVSHAEPEAPVDDAIAAAHAAADAALAAERPPPTTPQSPDTAALLAEIKRANDQAEASAKALRDLNGRYGGLAQQFEALKTQATAKAAAPVTQAPSVEQITQASKTPEKWEKFKKEWEDSGFADAIEEYVKSQLPQTPAAAANDEAKLKELVEAQLAAERATTAQALAEADRNIGLLKLEIAHPKWQDLVKSDEFKNWRTAQTPEVQALARSPRIEDASKMLTQFKSDTAASADRVATNRARLNAAVTHTTPMRRQSSVLSLDEMTPEQYWAYQDRIDAANEKQASSH